jgi:hypothetical protein
MTAYRPSDCRSQSRHLLCRNTSYELTAVNNGILPLYNVIHFCRCLLQEMHCGVLPPSSTLGVFRERAVHLLLLEAKAAKWYREVLPCVHTFFERLGSRLQDCCNAACCHNTTPSATTNSSNSSCSSGSGSNGSSTVATAAAAAAEEQLAIATAAISTEVKALREVLFRMPEGGRSATSYFHAAC